MGFITLSIGQTNFNKKGEKMNNSSFEILIPFGGFYESIHSATIDGIIENLATIEVSGQREISQTIADYLTDKIDFNVSRAVYAKSFSEYMSEELEDINSDLKIEFTALTSPPDYNYSTDNILANISQKGMKLIVQWVLDNKYHDYIYSLKNQKVYDYPINWNGFSNLVTDNSRDTKNWNGNNIKNTAVFLYVNSMISQSDFNFEGYDMGFNDYLTENMLNTLSKKQLAEYNKLVETAVYSELESENYCLGDEPGTLFGEHSIFKFHKS